MDFFPFKGFLALCKDGEIFGGKCFSRHLPLMYKSWFLALRFMRSAVLKTSGGLTLHVNYLFKHGIYSGNGFTVRLEPALGGNHVYKLLGEVNVGHFQGVGIYLPKPR